MAELQISVLGMLQVSQGGVQRLVTAPQLVGLLGYLALHSADGRPLSRDEMMEALYPDLPFAQARRAFSDALYRLRSFLGASEHCVVASERMLLLRAVQVDMTIFQRAARAPDLDSGLAALDLYRGDLLEQIDADWAIGQRALLRNLALVTFARVCDELIQKGQLSDALIYAHRWVEADPFDENAHHLAMRLYTLMNRYDAVISHYERLTRLFETELKSSPAPETRNLVEAVRRVGEPILFISETDSRTSWLTRVDEQQLEQLELLALLGNVWSASLLQRVLAADPKIVLGPLIQCGLISPQEDGFMFTKAELRQQILNQLSPARLIGPLARIVNTLQCLIDNVPQPVQVRLTRQAMSGKSPRGRGGQISVSWTVDVGEADRRILVSEGKVALRRKRVIRLLDEAAAQGAMPTVQDLARVLGVSLRTIEADLAVLRRTGEITSFPSGSS